MARACYRPLARSDISQIAGIHRRACLIAYGFMNWSYSHEEVEHWYATKFEEWDWGLVAEAETVVGFVATQNEHLDQLFVDPDHHGRGIGTTLLRAALARNPPSITLNVFAANVGARRFYERHGFKEERAFLNEADGALELVYRRSL